MKAWLGVGTIILTLVVSGDGFARQKGPEVLNVDNKISIRADAIPLASLMQLWDKATGMRSIVPAWLGNEKLSVHFSGLAVNEALERIFDGKGFGYILADNQVLVDVREPIESPAEPQPEETVAQSDLDAQDGSEVAEPIIPEEARQKAQPRPILVPTVPTPFGPVIAPPAYQPFVQLPPVQVQSVIPFFEPQIPTIPPAGAANGPIENTLFGRPLSILQDPILPSINFQPVPFGYQPR